MNDSSTTAQRWQMLALLAILGGLLWLLGPVLTPFVVSALLAWLGNPLVLRLERAGRSRTTGVILVFTLMILILLLALLVLVPLLENQISQFIDWLPRLADWIVQRAVPWLEAKLRMSLAGYLDPTYLIGLVKTHWQQAGGIAATVIGSLSKSGLAILGWVANILLIPVVTFYFLRDWPSMIERLHSLLPRSVEATAVRLARESDEVLGGFLRGQLSVMLVLGSIYAVGLWLVGLDLGLLIGMIAGLVSFVPYLGATFGLGAAVIATLVQHGDFMHLALVLVVFAIGQTAESFFLTPWLVGDRIGMHPVAVIFAIMAGGQLFGFLGVLLALPVTAVVMVGLRYGHERYTQSALYGASVAESSLPASPDSDPLTSRPDV